ncbi:MAG: 16S rRNA (uracil(1498)-N(3))-methyltransferase [Actinobacteria bacterium]|nr:16S rRNA (uracil(1498)-N(3))-methyltransferase [Actinomycetota bacterium]
MRQPPWFIAAPEHWTQTEVRLPPDESHHALRVMRITPPDVITVTDGCGTVARCAASRLEGDLLIAEVLDRAEKRRPKPQLVIYQGTPKGSKADGVVERLAELGAAELWFFDSERAVSKWSADKVARSSHRWAQRARSACKQSRNPFLMVTGGAISWTELLRRVAKEPMTIVLWEEASLPMRTALAGPLDRIALVVGPEGGLTRDEAESLADAGAQLVSLGPTILRTENAPVVAASALLYHYGLIG